MKLTLDQAWKYCMEMWGWIDGQLERNPKLDIRDLKRQWINQHPEAGNVSCHFCRYQNLNSLDSVGCPRCPGVLIDKEFSCCSDEYHYRFDPRLFYAELKRLYKIYKEHSGERED